jgi:fumarate reductase flavoprotein subunit
LDGQESWNFYHLQAAIISKVPLCSVYSIHLRDNTSQICEPLHVVGQCQWMGKTPKKGNNSLAENRKKSRGLAQEESAGSTGVVSASGDIVLELQNEGTPTVALPAARGIVPLKVVPIQRKDVIPDRKYSFETPPDPIPASDINETVATEVVVVGGGISGMGAALSAAEAGARVILVEKTATFKARGGDNGFIGSRLQKKLGIAIDQDEVILNLMKYGANKPDQRLLRLWADRGSETIDWLMDMTEAAGIEMTIKQFPPPAAFNPADEYYPSYLASHQCRQRDLVKCLMDNAIKKGVNIRFNTRARQLVKNEKGRVIGIIAQKADGSYVQFNADKAVVLCTGDYGYNAEMMAKYCPQAAYLASKLTTSTGDGHQMAMWAGAVMELAPHAPMTHGFAGPLGNSAFLQVNLKGERFHNEDVPGQSYTNAIEHQPGRTAWQVFDSKYPEELPYMGIGHGKINKATDEIKEFVNRIALKANTIEEVGKKMGVPIETFKATVQRHNELARVGKDLDFGKRSDRLTTLDKPPYYAGKGGYELLVVMGGLNVNTRLQPLDKDWEVIPGLYVGGNVVGNRFAVDYPLIVPGISHGMALVFGRIAGLNAATLEL